MKFNDKELSNAASKMIKSQKTASKPVKPKEPTDAAGWLRKAYIDAEPSDGAPKVGKIGYV